MLVTKQEFFESASINREFKELQRKKEEHSEFSIIPIIYNCYGEDALNEMVRRAYGQGDYSHQEAYRTCIEIMGIGRSGHLKVYLNEIKGDTLQAYQRNEMGSGRKAGAILALCEELYVIKEEI